MPLKHVFLPVQLGIEAMNQQIAGKGVSFVLMSAAAMENSFWQGARDRTLKGLGLWVSMHDCPSTPKVKTSYKTYVYKVRKI